MDKLELYHFHKIGDYDNCWKKGKTIVVDENFNSTTYNRIINFSTAIDLGNGTSADYYSYLMRLCKLEMIDWKIYNSLFDRATEIIFKANEFKRESALENFRLVNFPILPSRLHSVYLTDEKGINGWINKFGCANLALYRVEAEGNVFKTNEHFLPDEDFSYQKVYDNAYQYWHPNFKKAPDDSNEYLVQGKVKVLEKIKSI